MIPSKVEAVVPDARRLAAHGLAVSLLLVGAVAALFLLIRGSRISYQEGLTLASEALLFGHAIAAMAIILIATVLGQIVLQVAGVD